MHPAESTFAAAVDRCTWRQIERTALSFAQLRLSRNTEAMTQKLWKEGRASEFGGLINNLIVVLGIPYVNCARNGFAASPHV